MSITSEQLLISVPNTESRIRIFMSPRLSAQHAMRSLSLASVLGGFRAQGRTAVKARQVLDDALAVQDAGAFAVVLECVPSPVAKAVTEALEIPTIGIGAGAFTSGQVRAMERRKQGTWRCGYACLSCCFTELR